VYRTSSVWATCVTIVALFFGSSLLRSSNCVWAAESKAGQSVSANSNEEFTGENGHCYILVVNAITPYSCTIKLQYILLGDYRVCVRPARLPVLTRVTSSLLIGNNIQDTFLIGSAADTTVIRHIGLLTASSQAVSKPVWHLPLLCVQWKTPDEQRNSKHEEFYPKINFRN